MALRKILTEGDEQLLKHSRKVEKFDDRLHTLIDDMRETLENSGGVGLAAPQVGILRRVVVLLDVNQEPEEMVELVNPEVIEQKGSERVVEGCLSVPGVRRRPPCRRRLRTHSSAACSRLRPRHRSERRHPGAQHPRKPPAALARRRSDPVGGYRGR